MTSRQATTCRVPENTWNTYYLKTTVTISLRNGSLHAVLYMWG